MNDRMDCLKCSKRSKSVFEVKNVLLSLNELYELKGTLLANVVKSGEFFVRPARVLIVGEVPLCNGEKPFSSGVELKFRNFVSATLKKLGYEKSDVVLGFTYLFNCKTPEVSRPLSGCMDTFLKEASAFRPDVVIVVSLARKEAVSPDVVKFVIQEKLGKEVVVKNVSARDGAEAVKRGVFESMGTIKDHVVYFHVVKDDETYNKFKLFLKEKADKKSVVFVHHGSSFLFSRQGLDFLSKFESVSKRGLVPQGFSHFVVGWQGRKGLVAHAVPLWFSSLVDEHVVHLEGFLKEVREKRFSVTRKFFNASSFVDSLFVLKDLGFSRSFVSELKKKESPVGLDLQLSKVELSCARALEVLEKVQETKFYEFSSSLKAGNFLKDLLKCRLVLQDAQTFWSVLKKKVGIDLVKVLKKEDAEKSGVEGLNFYSGSEDDLEKGLSLKAEEFRKFVHEYRREVNDLKAWKRAEKKFSVVVPVGESFASRSPFDSFKIRNSFFNRVVLPIVIDLKVNGFKVSELGVKNILKDVYSAIEKLARFVVKVNGEGVSEEQLENVVRSVLNGKMSVISQYFKRPDEVAEVLSEAKSKGADVLLRLDDEELRRESVVVYSLRRLLRIKDVVEDVLFNVFDGRVHPSYYFNATRTGRVFCKFPAIFRWPAKSLQVCGSCGALKLKKETCIACGKKAEAVILDFPGVFSAGYFDLKQAEVVTLVNFSEDENLVRFLNSGGDVYCYFGALLSGKSYDEAFKAWQSGNPEGERIRLLGKKAVFKLVYGGRFSFLEKKFSNGFKGLVKWFKKVEEATSQTRTVGTLFGKVRTCEPDEDRLKVFVNTPVQGSTAELFFLILRLARDEFIKRGLPFRPEFVNQDCCYLDLEGVDPEKVKEVLEFVLEKVSEVRKVAAELGIGSLPVEKLKARYRCSFSF